MSLYFNNCKKIDFCISCRYMKNDITRFIFNLPVVVYEDLKAAANKRHMPMSQYILQALIWRLKKEEE